MRYQNYAAEDFIQDEHFQKWVITPDEATEKFWQNWLVKNPHKKQEVEEARRRIGLLNFGPDPTVNERFINVWQQLDTQWEKQSLPINSGFLLKSWHKVAASLTGILLLAAIYLFFIQPDKTITYATAFGETRMIRLPDSSIITLNANSTLTIAKVWDKEKPREAHLKGEAYFEIRKMNHSYHPSFVVHTGDLNVEVLGTAFNVNSRRKKTRVVLNSGIIQINTGEKSAVDDLIMKPGELLEFSQASKASVVRKVDPGLYSSWKNNELKFENTPLHEIIQLLEDTYGLQIRVENKSVLTKKYTGTFKGASSEIILESISTLFGLEVIKNKEEILLKDS